MTTVPASLTWGLRWTTEHQFCIRQISWLFGATPWHGMMKKSIGIHQEIPYDLQGRVAEEYPGRADSNFTTNKPSKGFDILITFTYALISQPITKGSIALWKDNCRSLWKEDYARDSIVLQNRRQASRGVKVERTNPSPVPASKHLALFVTGSRCHSCSYSSVHPQPNCVNVRSCSACVISHMPSCCPNWLSLCKLVRVCRI